MIVQLLLRTGADFKAKDKLGRTALQLAVETGHAAVIELLLKQEQAPNSMAEATIGRTPQSSCSPTRAWCGNESLAPPTTPPAV